MPVEVISNAYANFGVLGLIVIGFFGLVVYVVKSGERREEKLHKIIDVLAGELPEIRNTLNEIKDKVMKH